VEEDDTLNPMPSTSSMALSSRSSEAGSSRKSSVLTNVICADCKKVFVRGSLTDSITKHAKETSCKPFGCSFCPKHFKKVIEEFFELLKSIVTISNNIKTSLRNNHEKTHENLEPSIKRKAEEEAQTSAAMQPKLKRTKPLEDTASKSNVMKDVKEDPDSKV
jgi:hypothetical protein